MTSDSLLVTLSLALCKLENHKQLMADIRELVETAKKEALNKEYEIITEIYCQLGGFELELEHDMFRINNYYHFRSSKFEKPFERKSTVQEAVHEAAKKIGWSDCCPDHRLEKLLSPSSSG